MTLDELVEHWVAEARDRSQRALEMYEKDLQIDGDHIRALKHIANAFFDEGLAAARKK